jgi:DNA polymerase-1
VLENLKDEHEIVGLMLEYRAVTKLKNTYVDALPALVRPETGRVHTSFNQTGTSTGRISSSDPNLQNIPIRTEEGREVRRAFVAGDGCVLLAADYSQIELRIMAHIADAAELKEAFERGLDIHASTAATILGIPVEEVTPDRRRLAKAINFGLAYGQTAFGLSRQTGLGRSEAQEFIDRYFEKYPGVQEYIHDMKELAAERGYVETLLGRRRYFPNLARMRGPDRSRAEREAINMPIQGTAADIIKIAMIDLQRELDARKLESRALLQIHDELLLEVPRGELDEAAALVREVMEAVTHDERINLSVHLDVDVKVGENWLEMDEV